MDFQTLDKPALLRDQVYDSIRAELRRGALSPGHRLSEAGLAEALVAESDRSSAVMQYSGTS